MIKAICFDLDGVYFTSKGFSSFKEKIMNLGVSKEDTDYYLHGEPMLEFKRGEVSEEDYWQGAVDYWNLDIAPSEIIELLPLGYEIDPEVHKVLEQVKESGYKTCICSNNFVTRIEKLQKKFGFLEDFDVAVFSYEIGVTKPDKKIFEELIRRTNVKPEELVYSDDGEDKLKRALELGINAFLYENFEQFKDKLLELGVNLD